MKITCVYAHESEIAHLRKMVGKTAWSEDVSWLKWDGVGANPKAFSDAELVINAGFAGRLNDDIPLESIVFIGRLIDAVSGGAAEVEIDRYLVDAVDAFVVENYVPEVSLVTADNPVVNEKEKKALFERFDADIVDMEGWGIFHVSKIFGPPFICFKLVSDNADENARAIVAANKERLGRILGETLFDLFRKLVTCDDHGNLRNYSRL